MISRISGKIVARKEGILILSNGGFCYEVQVPSAVMNNIEKETGFNGDLQLITYHYYQMDQSRAMPVLIGFSNEIEKEFFEKFISVSGVGPKAACRALAEPFSQIAEAIDREDVPFLKSLPGIGAQRARLIVAKLQGKVAKFGLIQDERLSPLRQEDDISADAIDILLQLQYKRNEAEKMVQEARERSPEIKTSEDLLNEIYKEKKMD